MMKAEELKKYVKNSQTGYIETDWIIDAIISNIEAKSIDLPKERKRQLEYLIFSDAGFDVDLDKFVGHKIEE